MSEVDKMARALLAAEYDKVGSRRFAEGLRSGCDIGDSDTARAVQAIRAALLAAPEGFVMVPVEPTEEMRVAYDVEAMKVVGEPPLFHADCYATMLAAAPEPK